MTDTERLNLIEHYKWEISYDKEYGLTIKGTWGYIIAPNVRKAIEYALSAQARWALGT